ncbi:hypothetical protein HBA53_23545 (plasmid) [Rhodococcus pyridinivorans]|uniref:hypothetical protein n=1 Tax=Rhodococcus pyridinivorans TaxID=103816 RepID=UPI001C2F849F|nr:hypothetical protein [Rhodococcus pyridinivorans]QXF84090.1 hypothetical protein HBA53_23545 [Rhodococcus pyridinivorans]
MIGGPAETELFLAAVERARLTRLLAYPLQAKILIQQWRQADELPTNRAGAMDHAVGRMLTEGSNERPIGTLDIHRRQVISERLAALSLFCGMSAFLLGSADSLHAASNSSLNNGGTSTLPVDAVPLQDEPALSQVTVNDIREVLNTALFTTAGQGAVSFVHQSYAEFLAASYLVRRGVTGQRLVSILGADVNGLVPGPMIEVLGWLSALGAPVPDDLVAHNVQQLLSTAGLELVGEHVRERVVDELLRGAAAGTITEEWRANTPALSHPALATQLHEASRHVMNDQVAFWICRLARDCAVIEAADDLLEIASTSSLNATIRAEAVRAFAAVAPRDDMSKLQPLLNLDTAEDPDDEVLAAVLRAILTAPVDITSICRSLRPRRTPNFFGGYARLLGELPSLLPENYVLPVLTDILQRRPELDDLAFDRMIGGLLQRAWSMNDPEVCQDIGAVLSNELLSAHQLFPDKVPPWLEDDNPQRRYAMVASALKSGSKGYYPVLEMRMVTPADLGWLLDWICTAPLEAHEPTRVVLHRLAWNVPDAATAERVLEIDKTHPAFPALSVYQGQQPISERPAWQNHLIDDEEYIDAASLESQLHNALARSCDDITLWWTVVIALAGNQQLTEGCFGWDLTSRPLWATVPQEKQEDILRLGVDYVNTRHPEPHRWNDLASFTLEDVMPDWSGAILFTTLAAHRPDMLSDVTPSAWSSWSPVLVRMPNFVGDEDWRIWIRDAVPPTGRDTIDEALRERIRQDDDFSFARHPLADFSDIRLIDIVSHLARDSVRSQDRRNEAIEVLISHAPQIALNVARETVTSETVPSAAFTTLARLAPDELVSEWIEQGQLGPIECLAALDTAGLSDDSLLALSRMMLDEVPFAADRADTVRTLRSDAQVLRGRLLQTMTARGLASDLAALMDGRPEADCEQLRYLAQEARAREAVTKWQPVHPDMLMKFLAEGDARLVRDSAGLLTVLREQLHQIQNDLRERAYFRFLWDGEPGQEGASPKNEDTISDWIAHELQLRLNPHIVVDREIQVTRPSNKGSGTRIDITATSGGTNVGRVIFEAKLVKNSELPTAIDNQLVDQYLIPTRTSHGIYIVYWVSPELRPKKWPKKKYRDAHQLGEILREQARRHQPNTNIEVFVLDIGRPA